MVCSYTITSKALATMLRVRGLRMSANTTHSGKSTCKTMLNHDPVSDAAAIPSIAVIAPSNDSPVAPNCCKCSIGRLNFLHLGWRVVCRCLSLLENHFQGGFGCGASMLRAYASKCKIHRANARILLYRGFPKLGVPFWGSLS